MQNDLSAVKLFVQELSFPRQFEIGDVVVWKGKDFKNKTRPELDQKTIVSYVYPQVIFTSDEEGVGTSYECEPITIRLSFINKDGDIVEYPYDSRRFRLAD